MGEYCDHCLNSSHQGFAPASDSTIVSSDILRDYGVASEHSTVDPSKHSCKTLRHLYEKCGGQGQRPTTPLLLDTKTDRGVNNESMELATFLNEWGAGTGPDLFPTSLRTEIEAMNQWIYPINNGVYRCGFASSQPAYDEAAVELEGRMTEVEKYLGEGSRRFLVGDNLTISDIRLFNTLIRMDEVYVTYFKCYFVSLFAPFGSGESKFPNLLRFTARVYNEFPEIRECLNMDDIRAHYFTSHAIRNMFAIIPNEVGVCRRLEAMKEQ